jgi:hypothetical protein
MHNAMTQEYTTNNRMITFSSVTGMEIAVITIIILVILDKIGDSIVEWGLESSAN